MRPRSAPGAAGPTPPALPPALQTDAAALELLLCGFAVLGRATVASLPQFWLTVVLGVGTVALLYLVTEELLVQAHEADESAWTVSAFFAGFLAFLLLEMAVD